MLTLTSLINARIVHPRLLKKKKHIEQVGEEYNVKSLEQLDEIIELFQRLSKYLSNETNNIIDKITSNSSGLSPEQKAYLLEIKEQAVLLRKLEKIKIIGFDSLKDVGKIINELNGYKIELQYITHMNSEHTNNKVNMINNSLDEVIAKKAGLLQGKVNAQNDTIRRTIEKYHKKINHFLKYAGYNYNVFIEKDVDGRYKMKLRHVETTSDIEDVKRNLSYGERNAFALVLFMYATLRTRPIFLWYWMTQFRHSMVIKNLQL